ncbi:MAG: hypothetical protein CSA15_11815 [Candidatus Delongbacteria bacterium]|nr:MAG: hypothetical protein CSA15_11815 [Candidatus Delongbacteria bacterium]
MRLSSLFLLFFIFTSIVVSKPLEYLFEKYKEEELSKGVEIEEEITLFSKNLLDREFKEISYESLLKSEYTLIFGDTPYA